MIGFWSMCNGMLHGRRLTCLEKLTSRTGNLYDRSETIEGEIRAVQAAFALLLFLITDTSEVGKTFRA